MGKAQIAMQVPAGVNPGDAVNGGTLCLYLLPWTRRESPWLKMFKPLLFKLMFNLHLGLSLSLRNNKSMNNHTQHCCAACVMQPEILE